MRHFENPSIHKSHMIGVAQYFWKSGSVCSCAESFSSPRDTDRYDQFQNHNIIKQLHITLKCVIRIDLSLDTSSAHCSPNCPRAEMPNFWKIFLNKSIWTLAGAAASCARSFGQASPHLSVVRPLLINWAGRTFYLQLLGPSPIFLISNPLESKCRTKFLITGHWQKQKKTYFVVLILILAFLPNSRHYFEPFTCLNEGPQSLLWSGNRIPLTWPLGTFPAFSSRYFWENHRNDYSIFQSVSNRGRLAPTENRRKILPPAGGGKRAVAQASSGRRREHLILL